mmetsp:Transcript_30364/g.92870  ORF Transcript_30364/g.92870 Transcript_30364/m.92870 type:complete len:438 (-) Transcript_30364:508-1821(-)
MGDAGGCAPDADADADVRGAWRDLDGDGVAVDAGLAAEHGEGLADFHGRVVEGPGVGVRVREHRFVRRGAVDVGRVEDVGPVHEDPGAVGAVLAVFEEEAGVLLFALELDAGGERAGEAFVVDALELKRATGIAVGGATVVVVGLDGLQRRVVDPVKNRFFDHHEVAAAVEDAAVPHDRVLGAVLVPRVLGVGVRVAPLAAALHRRRVTAAPVVAELVHEERVVGFGEQVQREPRQPDPGEAFEVPAFALVLNDRHVVVVVDVVAGLPRGVKRHGVDRVRILHAPVRQVQCRGGAVVLRVARQTHRRRHRRRHVELAVARGVEEVVRHVHDLPEIRVDVAAVVARDLAVVEAAGAVRGEFPGAHGNHEHRLGAQQQVVRGLRVDDRQSRRRPLPQEPTALLRLLRRRLHDRLLNQLRRVRLVERAAELEAGDGDSEA